MKPSPPTLLAISVLLCAGMWLYVSRVIVPQQKAYAAIHGNPRGNLSDLYPRWLGSRELLLHGRDPYSPEITREIQVGYYGRELDASRPDDPGDQEAFAYPVYVALLLAPTVTLPFPVAQTIFRWTLAGLTVFSVLLWLRVVNWKPPLIVQVALLILTQGTFWVVQGIKLQQLTLLVAPMIAASVYFLIKNRQVAAGILLGVATVKPQIALPLAAWLMLWACSRIRLRWKLVAAFVATLLTLAAAGEVLLPGWIHEFYSALHAYRGYTRHLSPLDELVTPTLGIPLAILVSAVVALMCWRARKIPAESELLCWTTALVLAANLLVIPTIAPYNQLLLLPGVFLLLQTWNRTAKLKRTIRVLGWLAAGCLAWPLITAAGLTLFSFITPAVQRFWEVPLWTSIVIPIPITAALALCARQVQSRSREAALTTTTGN
jgi:Glycosyltransferase family 87